VKKNKTVIIIAGPTASGKTNLSIRLAQYFKTHIVSADSRQCFNELNIGVAKPTLEQLETVKHYFINSHSINDEVNAALYERYALSAAEEIFRDHDIAIMVGGTGLYIKAFCEGLDAIPEIDTYLRLQIIDDYEKNGLAWLQQQVQKNDPLFWEKGETQNPQRLMRALEVILGTGRSIIEHRSSNIVERPFNIIKFATDVPREDLYNNVNQRVDEMIRDGLLFEVRSLVEFQKLNALQTVGYKELFDHINGNISLEEAIDEIKKNTRHYAKRQLTWFKKDPQFHWISPGISAEEIEVSIQKALANASAS
jgi:tRNA dimethylallyltransferase